MKVTTRKRPLAGGDGEMPIGRLAEQTGLSTATINFYVAEGVLPPPRKLNRTRAAYTSRHLRLLRMVKQLQGAGYTLAQIKGAFASFGTDERGLKKLEGIGSLQPLPPPKTGKDQRPIERFAPMAEKAFLTKTGCDARLLRALVQRGIVRPTTPGHYDASDLWVVRFIDAMLQDGVTLDELAPLVDLIPLVRRTIPVVMKRAAVHRDALRARTLRFRDLLEPLQHMLAYAFERTATEADPGWRDRLYDGR